MALAHIGVSTFIASAGERSKEATICNQFFEPVRDSLLEAFEWSFASRRVSLALTDVEITNWLYAYKYPADCVAARRLVYEGLRNPRSDQRIPYEIGYDGTQRLILTDQVDAELIYTARITDPNLFSPLFVTAFAWLLAEPIAMPLAVSTSLADRAAKRASQWLSAAIAGNLREGQEDQPAESEFISARA